MVRTSSSNLLLYRRMLKGLSFIARKMMGEGRGGGGGGEAAILRGGYFQNFEIGSGGHFQITDHYLGIILLNFMKVGQSSNEEELKLNVTAVNRIK